MKPPLVTECLSQREESFSLGVNHSSPHACGLIHACFIYSEEGESTCGLRDAVYLSYLREARESGVLSGVQGPGQVVGAAPCGLFHGSTVLPSLS